MVLVFVVYTTKFTISTCDFDGETPDSKKPENYRSAVGKLPNQQRVKRIKDYTTVALSIHNKML